MNSIHFARFLGIARIRMALAQSITKRNNKQRKLCDVCNRAFLNFEAAEEHRRKVHPDVMV
jgi:hypothetical protein